MQVGVLAVLWGQKIEVCPHCPQIKFLVSVTGHLGRKISDYKLVLLSTA